MTHSNPFQRSEMERTVDFLYIETNKLKATLPFCLDRVQCVPYEHSWSNSYSGNYDESLVVLICPL